MGFSPQNSSAALAKAFDSFRELQMFPCAFLANEGRCELTTSATTAPSPGLPLVLRVKIGIYRFVGDVWEKNPAMPEGSTNPAAPPRLP